MMEDRVKSIWNAFSHELYKYVRSKVNSDYDAEDILQDIFIKIHKNIHKVNEQSKLKAWLYKIAKNTIIDYYRKNKGRTVDIASIDKALEEEDDAHNMNKEISRCLKKMIEELPEKYQEIIELYDIQGMKHKEISEKLGLSLSGSKMRVHRGKELLKQILLACCDFELDKYGNILDYTQKSLVCKRCDNQCE